MDRLDSGIVGTADHRTARRSCSEEDAGLQTDGLDVFLHRDRLAVLVVDVHLLSPREVPDGDRDHFHDLSENIIRNIELAHDIERLREEGIPCKDGGLHAVFHVRCDHSAAHLVAVHEVIVDECEVVDVFYGDRKRDRFGSVSADRSAGGDDHRRSHPLSAGIRILSRCLYEVRGEFVRNVRFDRSVEFLRHLFHLCNNIHFHSTHCLVSPRTT